MRAGFAQVGIASRRGIEHSGQGAMTGLHHEIISR
jgi:hypothetical protein